MGRMRQEIAGRAAPERVACVWLPQFAVWVERIRWPRFEGRPLVLVGSEDGRAPVARACSAEAVAAGVSPGAAAHSVPRRCPEAVVLPFDQRHYEERYEALLQALEAVSPQIEAQPLEVFYLDLTRLPHLDPEEPEQVMAAVRAVVPPPFMPRIGIAPGKFRAWVAANLASPVRPVKVTDEERLLFLQEVPSALLPVDAETARRLHLMGLRTLGRIARLPRSAMLAQFGRQGERAHRLACGEDREALLVCPAAPVLRETLMFPAPPTVAGFYMALHQLLERVCSRPERQGRGVRQVRLEALVEDGTPWARTITLRQPLEEWALVFAELRRRLEPVRPSGALIDLTVELTALAAHVGEQRVLFRDERQQRRESLAGELCQLRERLRRSSVYRVVEVEPWSRLPEKRYALLSYDA